MTKQIPLAERLRPQNLETFIGQEHLIGKNGIIRQMLENKQVSSMIFWGPPGVGKTTLAKIIGKELQKNYYTLSAISAGVKDIRQVIQQSRLLGGSVLFIDEIHRFNKSQQDALLGAVEEGIITLIGATTENPSFEVNAALLSRSQVYVLKPLESGELNKLLDYALKEDVILKDKDIEIQETEALFRLSGGDARKLLNALELVVNASTTPIKIHNKMVLENIQKNIAIYDKSGEQHYDIISAFIKSIRGSDPNASVYWLARMIVGGEDPKFIARRMLISASEDIGNANPTALALATSCFEAVNYIGYPEARIILSQTAIYLANSPKSNASYMAIDSAISFIKKTGDLPVPLHLRNAPTNLMKKQGYGKEYKYSHNFPQSFVNQEYLPKSISGKKFYEPGHNSREESFRKRLQDLWGGKYDY